MSSCFKILILIWVLQLTASSAQPLGLNGTINNVTAGMITENATGGQITTNPSLQVLNHTMTPSITAIVNPTVETMQAQTKPSKTLLPNYQNAAPTNSISTELSTLKLSLNATTEVQTKARTTPTRIGNTPSSNPATSTILSFTPSNLTQGQAITMTFHATTNELTLISTRPAQSTKPTFTTTISNMPTDDKFTRSAPSSAPSSAPTHMPVTIHTTTMKKKKINGNMKTKNSSQRTPGKSTEGTNHGKVVAGLIGGALTVMMLGFLLIFIKKQRLQKQQITTTDWAGPSPFLEGAVESGMTDHRSSNRISLSSFLPQRLSKRLSLLPEADEELQEIAKGTTFGDKHQGITFGQEEHGSDVQKSNGTAAALSEKKDTRDAPETNENPVSVSTSQTNNPISTNDNIGGEDLGQGSPSTASIPVESPTVKLNNDLNAKS